MNKFLALLFASLLFAGVAHAEDHADGHHDDAAVEEKTMDDTHGDDHDHMDDDHENGDDHAADGDDHGDDVVDEEAAE